MAIYWDTLFGFSLENKEQLAIFHYLSHNTTDLWSKIDQTLCAIAHRMYILRLE